MLMILSDNNETVEQESQEKQIKGVTKRGWMREREREKVREAKRQKEQGE